MKIRHLLVLILGLSFFLNAQAKRVDSMNIHHSEIHLDMRNIASKTIAGNVKLTIQFKIATNFVRLDLKQLTTDSVFNKSSKLTFSTINESLNIQLGQTYQVNDTVVLNIFYHGTPAQDPSGWGGFYFTGDYAFNLGVGFAVYPHSFGRAWMPCVDEFDMKSQYEMYVETDPLYRAACNGLLIDVNNKGTSKVWHYKETVPMSAYLASVSVSKFYVMQSNYNGISNAFPVELFGLEKDTAATKLAFRNLPKAIQFFEEAFGPQPYSKVGYNFVPFNAGAMEHAGNITYPASFSVSDLYQRTMAHELSHHWWGDLVTCKDAGDMWLNEGWASYCEFLFIEKLYGDSAAKVDVYNDNYSVLRYAHITDGGIYPLINIPETITYGRHVYKKGASTIHSLRGVMGDSAFFAACKLYLSRYKLKNATSADMQAVFAEVGGAKVQQFFEDFVFNVGFPHIIIQKQIHSGSGPFNLTFNTLQKPRFKSGVYKNLPVEVFFFKDKSTFEKRTIVVNAEEETHSVTLPFKPIMVCIDYNQKLNDAITDKNYVFNSVGKKTLDFGFGSITAKTSDTAFLRFEHHWVGPEKYITTYPYMSNYRYVSIDGIWKDAFAFDLELTYDGRVGATGGDINYLDHTLIFKTEDSLTVLYRAFPGDHWREWTDMTFTYGNKNNKQGTVLIKNAKKGDYVFAMKDKNLSIDHGSINQPFQIYPNPASNEIRIESKVGLTEQVQIELFDINGKCVLNKKVMMENSSIKLNISDYSAGLYTCKLTAADTQFSQKIVISK